MSLQRRRWHLSGRVQGVGFRYYARYAAQHLGLTGWVANNWDGTVTLEAQGEASNLDRLVPLIEQSNRWISMDAVESRSLPPLDREYGFTVRDGE